MTRLAKLRADIQQKERPPRKKQKTEMAEQRSACLEARKVKLLKSARTMLGRIEEITTAGKCTSEMRLMRDELVEGLWALRHTKREIKGLPTRVLQ